MTEQIRSNKKRLLFIIDHKHRDLPGNALIGHYLEEMGYETVFIALTKEDPVVETFDPHVIILPKPVYPLNKLLRWKFSGRKIFVVDTEGNPQDKEYRMKIYYPVDIYYFWNQGIKDRYNNSSTLRETEKVVLGCPRMDFLHPSFLKLLPSRKEMLDDLGLTDRKTITIATSIQDAHFSEKEIEQQNKTRSKVLDQTADYLTIIENLKKLKVFSEEIVREISKKYPQYNLVIKPHPNENILSWKELVESLDNKNVKLCTGRTINEFLQISDVHVANNVCTTIFEALVRGIPAIETRTDLTSVLYADDHLKVTPYQVYNWQETSAILETLLEDKDHEQKQNSFEYLPQYIDQYFYKVDGKRCLEYARSIHEHIKNIPDKLHRFGFWDKTIFCLKHPRLTLKYYETKLRLILRPLKYGFAKAKQMQKQQSGKIDHRGRFDNRISPGDAQEWIEKYKAHGFTLDSVEKASLKKQAS